MLVRPKRGLYALEPKQLDLLISLQSTGVKEPKSIDITSADKYPILFPKEKKFYLRGKRWKIILRHYLQKVGNNYFSFLGDGLLLTLQKINLFLKSKIYSNV